jgi:16S rRNA (adenine1518-N6/adenine1519-N6)-dimethyltransferase
MPLSPTETRAVLERLAHRPRHSLGQNFLIDGNIVRKSLELAQVGAGDQVVEVGPGLGTLTAALLTAGAEVWAVEMDPTLHRHLAETLSPGHPGQLHLLQGDAMEEPRAGWTGPGDFKIVANLPYAIATPWLDAILEGALPQRMVLMLQQEAAQRYTAAPGGKTFGAISVFLQSAYAFVPGHKVAAACFYPRPEIESYLLNLVRRPHPVVLSRPAKNLIRGCFQQRRKQIGRLLRELRPLDGEDRLAQAGVAPQARPEAIPVAAWIALTAGL